MAPYLILPLFLFIGLLLLLIPFKFTLDSIFNLITVPVQLYHIATNPVLRKNHGLEHATVNVLEREFGYKNLAGYAENSGFYIIGADNVHLVEEAARRGLRLMRSGYSDLAIHRRCGTSLTVANFVSAVIFLLLLFYTGYFSLFYIIMAIIIANIVAKPLGMFVQQYFTTTSDVGDIQIVRAEYVNMDNFWNQPVKIFVHTRQIPYIN